jgi:transcriptional regulator with XRE-family HTH domain
MSPRRARTKLGPRQAKRLGAFIRQHRQAAGLTAQQLGQAVGVDKTTILRIEAGSIREPSPATLQRVARVLKVDLEDIFALAGYATPEGLPSLTPYLRTKYGELPEEALAEAERFFTELTERYATEEDDGNRPR